jgi:hypothetical protein
MTSAETKGTDLVIIFMGNIVSTNQVYQELWKVSVQ